MKLKKVFGLLVSVFVFFIVVFIFANWNDAEIPPEMKPILELRSPPLDPNLEKALSVANDLGNKDCSVIFRAKDLSFDEVKKEKKLVQQCIHSRRQALEPLQEALISNPKLVGVGATHGIRMTMKPVVLGHYKLAELRLQWAENDPHLKKNIEDYRDYLVRSLEQEDLSMMLALLYQHQIIELNEFIRQVQVTQPNRKIDIARVTTTPEELLKRAKAGDIRQNETFYPPDPHRYWEMFNFEEAEPSAVKRVIANTITPFLIQKNRTSIELARLAHLIPPEGFSLISWMQNYTGREYLAKIVILPIWEEREKKLRTNHERLTSKHRN